MISLGTKRECPECETKFYDLGDPEKPCPKCGASPESQDGGSESPEPKKRRRVAKDSEEESAADDESEDEEEASDDDIEELDLERSSRIDEDEPDSVIDDEATAQGDDADDSTDDTDDDLDDDDDEDGDY